MPIILMISSKRITRTLLLFVLSVVSLNSFSQVDPTSSVSVSAGPSNNPSKPLDQPFAKLKEEVIQDKRFDRPIFQGKAGISLFSEDTTSGPKSGTPSSNYMKGYILGNLYFTPDLYLSANLRFNSDKGGVSFDYFDGLSAFWAELALRYDADNYSLVMGHASVNYSLSRDYMAGLWGKAYAKKEYGVDGMMVLGGSYKIDGKKYGNHALSATAFMVDTTGLSDTYGSTRDPTPLSIGGPANTGKFNNFAFAIDGLNIAALPKFRYQVAAVRLVTESLYVSETKQYVPIQYLANEQRYVVAGMFNKLDIGAKVKLSPLLEYNRVINAGGISGFNKSYYVGSLLFGYKKWNLGISAALWDAAWSKVPNAVKSKIPSNAYNSDRWNNEQIAIGYSFDNGIKATLGYKKENEKTGTTNQTIGINLKYDLPFAF